MPEADITNKAREREQAPRETVRPIPQATTTDGNRQPTPVAVLLFRIGDVFLLISSVGVRLSDTGVSGYRTLVPMALRGHGAGAGVVQPSLAAFGPRQNLVSPSISRSFTFLPVPPSLPAKRATR